MNIQKNGFLQIFLTKKSILLMKYLRFVQQPLVSAVQTKKHTAMGRTLLYVLQFHAISALETAQQNMAFHSGDAVKGV